jgi:hypothetical protein
LGTRAKNPDQRPHRQQQQQQQQSLLLLLLLVWSLDGRCLQLPACLLEKHWNLNETMQSIHIVMTNHNRVVTGKVVDQ